MQSEISFGGAGVAAFIPETLSLFLSLFLKEKKLTFNSITFEIMTVFKLIIIIVINIIIIITH